ncbi:hypothetical protein IQ250_28555 [Pseudanabaenaceae cyanobacterium LEGE 13415]|nr:hypothetical protein [Pseudanabaenaceae cyanobacterium LEGE 13415]
MTTNIDIGKALPQERWTEFFDQFSDGNRGRSLDQHQQFRRSRDDCTSQTDSASRAVLYQGIGREASQVGR